MAYQKKNTSYKNYFLFVYSLTSLLAIPPADIPEELRHPAPVSLLGGAIFPGPVFARRVLSDTDWARSNPIYVEGCR